MTLTLPLKWHGGKSYLATRIVAMMPEHTHYVEPFAGGLSVLLAKDSQGVSEVVNDLHLDLTNFWRVMQSGDWFAEFVRLCEATPFSEADWRTAELELAEWERPDEQVSTPSVRAWRFFILCRQSLAGRMDAFAPLSRNRTRRGMNEQASAWLNAVERLPAVHARLKRVVVLNRDAIDVIRQQDGPKTLFYLDPPYLHETRATTGEYAHEMTGEQHVALIHAIESIQGKFLLSGYRSALYDHHAKQLGWHRTDFDLANNAAGGAEKRRMTECVWTNFEPTAHAAGGEG